MDLCDESGNLKYLANHPMSYATEILKERESLVLIRVESKLFPRFVYSFSLKKIVAWNLVVIVPSSKSVTLCFVNKCPAYLLSQHVHQSLSFSHYFSFVFIVQLLFFQRHFSKYLH